jgi:hypothetical protein
LAQQHLLLDAQTLRAPLERGLEDRRRLRLKVAHPAVVAFSAYGLGREQFALRMSDAESLTQGNGNVFQRLDDSATLLPSTRRSI